MNLLTERWIPVMRQSGADLIAPYEISALDNPVLSINASRADFNGAIIQFLIGLLQTVLPDLKRKHWRQWQQVPPSSDELKKIFMPLEIAFNFDSDGARFMQDYNLLEGDKKSVSALFIDQPGEQTLELNTDHFVKRDSIKQICFHCSAIALFTLQINAPSGGAGHRTSVRGGGPLTTLIVSDTEESKLLWNMLWLNVIPAIDFKALTGNETLEISELKDVFPWLAPTRTSEKNSGATYINQNAHPFQMYWCMPRRIQLDFANTTQGECHVCGNANRQLVQHYITKNYGVNYLGSWQHLLSPHRKDKDAQYIPLHPQPGGIGYKYWQAIALNDSRAKVVRAQQENLKTTMKIWSFGYDMDNMKARCWYESTMPSYYIKPEILKAFESLTTQYIDSAIQILKYLYFSLKETKAHIPTTEANFWHQTETIFYQILNETVQILSQNASADVNNIKQTWLIHLQKKALLIFDTYTEVMHAELLQLQHLAQARKGLRKNLYGPKIRKSLALDEKEVKNA